MSVLCKPFEVAAKGDPGKGRFDFAEHRAVFGRRRHFRIKRLDMSRAALEVEHHNRPIFHNRIATGSGPGLQLK